MKNWYTNTRKFHYIYKTTCLVTNRYYIGMHSTDDLEDGYVGSGTRLWHSIKKYGQEKHKCEILEFLPSRESLKERERELVNEETLKDSQCMNLALGGGSGWEIVNKCLTPENRTKAGKAGGYANLTFEQRSIVGKLYGNLGGKRTWESNPEQAEISRQKATLAAQSEEAKRKRKITRELNPQTGERNGSFGTCLIHKENTQKRVKKIELESFLQDGWKLGMSEACKEKIRIKCKELARK